MAVIKKRAILASIVSVFILAAGIIAYHIIVNMEQNQEFQILLRGQGEFWLVENYTIIKTKSTITRGKAELTYLRDPAEIEHSDYIKYTFYELDANHQPRSVGSVRGTSNWNLNLPDYTKQLGYGTSKLFEEEKKMTPEDFAGSYLEIEWTNHRGELNKDIIHLEIYEVIQNPTKH